MKFIIMVKLYLYGARIKPLTPYHQKNNPFNKPNTHDVTNNHLPSSYFGFFSLR